MTRALSKGTRPAKRTGIEGARDGDDDFVRISVILTKEERHRLKVVAAERGTTISDIVREGISRFLSGRAR